MFKSVLNSGQSNHDRVQPMALLPCDLCGFKNRLLKIRMPMGFALAYLPTHIYTLTEPYTHAYYIKGIFHNHLYKYMYTLSHTSRAGG